MYIAPVDAAVGETEWRPFVTSQGFDHMVADGRDRDLPVVVPTQFLLRGGEVLLHLVAPNPVFAALEENHRALLSVAGDWTFVPSNFKVVGDEDPRLGIPTTYYSAVQLIGTATLVDDPDEIAAILRAQLAALQPGVDVADPAEVHRPRLARIRGIRVAIDDVRAKFKYGGNVDAAHRQAVIEHLRRRDGPGDRVAAAHAARRLAAAVDVASLAGPGTGS